MLECRWCIIQSKQKYSVLKQPIPGDKSCLFTGIVSQLDLVVTTSQVNCKQETSFRQLVQQVIYAQQRIDMLAESCVLCFHVCVCALT